MFVAVLRTTISAYLFFWQASEVAEEDVAKDGYFMIRVLPTYMPALEPNVRTLPNPRYIAK